MCFTVLKFGWLAFIIIIARVEYCTAETIIIGDGQGGWTLGVDYTNPIEAAVGDELVFNYMPGVHDVWTLPSETCEFTPANGAKLVSPANQSPYTHTLSAPGDVIFGCSIASHCTAGMLLKVTVRPEGTPKPPLGVRPPPSAGVASEEGTCSTPLTDTETGLTTVNCMSPGVELAPGDNEYPTIPLPLAFPPDRSVAIHTLSAEVVDGTGRPVPLTEVYLHHIFGDYRYIPGEGAEVRRSPFREPLPAPFAILVDGSKFTDEFRRFANFHIINTIGVAEKDLKPCIECWCDTADSTAPSGSIGCCSKCETSSTAPPQKYHLQYNVTYKDVADEVRPVQPFSLDIAGAVEYSVTPLGNGTLNKITRTYPLDYFCPQEKPFGLLECWAHQHIGGKCIRVTDDTTGELICESCPEYGTQPGEVGNEAGYVVGMSARRFETPYMLQPGQKVKVEALYDAEQPYAGVMSILNILVTDFTADNCTIDYAAFIQPPAEGGRDPVALEEQAMEAIEAIPEDCGEISNYLDENIVPCIPLALSKVAGRSVGMEDMSICCDMVKSGGGGFQGLTNIILPIAARTECLCPLGETLRQSLETGILSALGEINNMCTGSKDAVTSVAQGAAVALNSFFAPACPELKAALEDTKTSTNPEATPVVAAPESSEGENTSAGGQAPTAPESGAWRETRASGHMLGVSFAIFSLWLGTA